MIINKDEIYKGDFEEMVGANCLEVFEKSQFDAYIEQATDLIEKSENTEEELTEEEKNTLDILKAEVESFQRFIVIDYDDTSKITKSIKYCREQQVEWNKEENEEGEILKSKTGVYLDTPLNQELNRVGMDYDEVNKAKYIRREGSPGNYKYIYKEVEDKIGYAEGKEGVDKYINKMVNEMPEHLKEDTRDILRIISKERSIKNRVSSIESKLNLFPSELPMGSGGTGQIKEMKDHYRIQIAYGKGKYNYALAITLPKK